MKVSMYVDPCRPGLRGWDHAGMRIDAPTVVLDAARRDLLDATRAKPGPVC